MNARQRRKERRRTERRCFQYAAESRWFKAQGLDDAARGCHVLAVEGLADVRCYVPGRRLSWWMRNGKPPEVIFAGLRGWSDRVRRRLGMFWRGKLARELGLLQ